MLCFTWNIGNACEGNLLRLRSCFEACFMGWLWRIRANERWIGRVLSLSFVFSGVSMLLDVSRETRRFYNNPFVSRKTLFCFTTSQGCQCVSRETLVLNLIQLLGNAVQRLKALTCMTTF